MSILAQIIGLACLLFWGFWLCCKLRLPAGFAPLCGLCFCMVVLQLAGSCNLLWLGAQLLLVGAVLTLAQRRRHEILPQQRCKRPAHPGRAAGAKFRDGGAAPG